MSGLGSVRITFNFIGSSQSIENYVGPIPRIGEMVCPPHGGTGRVVGVIHYFPLDGSIRSQQRIILHLENA